MRTKKPRESASGSHRESISDHASDWIRQFIKHLELNFVDSSQSLPPHANMPEYHDATLRAILQTLVDSGMDMESVVEAIGRASIDRQSGSVEWNTKLNRRRFALIEEDIQGTLTARKRIDLVGLTNIIREQVESEANLPMEGARALHRKLMEGYPVRFRNIWVIDKP